MLIPFLIIAKRCNFFVHAFNSLVYFPREINLSCSLQFYEAYIFNKYLLNELMKGFIETNDGYDFSAIISIYIIHHTY